VSELSEFKIAMSENLHAKTELFEHLKSLSEAVKLVVDRVASLLGFLLCKWLEQRLVVNPAPEIPKAANDERLLTVTEAAQFLHLTRRTIYNYNKNGKLKPRYVGNEPRYARSELERLLETDTAQRRGEMTSP